MPFLSGILRDLRYSVAVLNRTRRFTCAVAFTIAISLALNAVIFSVAYDTLIRPLKYPAPDRLVTLHIKHANGETTEAIPFGTFKMLQQINTPLANVAAVYPIGVGVNLAAAGVAEYVRALRISPELFPVLQAVPADGRNFTQYDQEARPLSVLLSHHAWQTLFKGATFHDGHTVSVNGIESNIVGVLPESVATYPQADLWLPLEPEATSLRGSNCVVIGRLKSAITMHQAVLDFQLFSEEHHLVDARNGRIILVPQQLQGAMTESVRKGILALLAGSVFLFIVAATNVAILVSIRNTRRLREVAIRAAMGATKYQLIRWLMSESAILALMGGALGTILAKEALPFVVRLIPQSLPVPDSIGLGWAVLIFVAGETMFTALYLGLISAAPVVRLQVTQVMKGSPAERHSRWSFRLLSQPPSIRATRPLISARTALSTIILTGAFLLVRRYVELATVPPGFEVRHLWVAQVFLSAEKYATSDQTTDFLNRVLNKLQDSNDVERAASVNGLPFERGLNLPVFGVDAKTGLQDAVNYRIVTGDYFSVMQTPVSGNPFPRMDKAAEPVAAIDATLARLLWPRGNAIGNQVKVGNELGSPFVDNPRRVIAIASDMYAENWVRNESGPTIYVPAGQSADSITRFANQNFLTSIAIRTRRDADLRPAVEAAVSAADPDLPIVSIMPMSEGMKLSLARQYFDAALAGTIGTFTLILGVVSILGLLNFLYTHRHKEIAVRVAVGAKRGEIIAMVVAEGIRLSLAGAIPGMAGAAFLNHLLQRVIYKHPAGIDLGIITAAIVLLTAVDAIASIAVALQVASASPMTVLREQ